MRSVAGGSGFLAPDLAGRREDAACPLRSVQNLDQLILVADERFRGDDCLYPRIEQRHAPIICSKHKASAGHAGAVHGLVGLLRRGQQGLVRLVEMKPAANVSCHHNIRVEHHDAGIRIMTSGLQHDLDS